MLEGVAFALADGLDALRDAGTHVDRLSVIGGGARSRYWGETLSAVLGVELVYLKGGETMRLGIDGLGVQTQKVVKA